ncbi:unnamed protein product [Gongylonema pulchrum]|uniref:Ovule protein n=1 Tax=Gongylonema pulchrum TaxID=637853 RepID=A0A183EPP4_9BILA|nr:unnamed protein product [Gongylonema pulchrum]
MADLKPAMSKMLETCLTFDPSFSDSQNSALFHSNLPVYLLGKTYKSREGMFIFYCVSFLIQRIQDRLNSRYGHPMLMCCCF